MSDTATPAKPATIVEVMKFFNYPTTAAFRRDWADLTETDKEQIKQGLGDGSMTY